MNRTIGLILVIVGIVMLIWSGFTYTKREKIIDAGPLQVSADRQKTVSWPPYAGGIYCSAGLFYWLLERRNRFLKLRTSLSAPSKQEDLF